MDQMLLLSPINAFRKRSRPPRIQPYSAVILFGTVNVVTPSGIMTMLNRFVTVLRDDFIPLERKINLIRGITQCNTRIPPLEQVVEAVIAIKTDIEDALVYHSKNDAERELAAYKIEMYTIIIEAIACGEDITASPITLTVIEEYLKCIKGQTSVVEHTRDLEAFINSKYFI